MDYVSISQTARAEIASIREAGILVRTHNPAVRNFILDIDMWTKLEEFPDRIVGMIVSRATAENLMTLGYTGPRANSGKSSIPFFTAGVVRMKAAFGKDKVIGDAMACGGGEHGVHRRPRFIKNETTVRETFCRILDQLAFDLLASESSQRTAMRRPSRCA